MHEALPYPIDLSTAKLFNEEEGVTLRQEKPSISSRNSSSRQANLNSLSRSANFKLSKLANST